MFLSRIVVLLTASLLTLGNLFAAEVSDREDSALLSAVLKRNCDYAASRDEQKIIILSADSSPVGVTSVNYELDRGAVESLLLRNKTSHTLSRINLCPLYRLTPLRQIRAALEPSVLGGGGWQEFHKVFPGAAGTAYLSLPGYSSNGELAIVQVSRGCDYFCGSGFNLVFRKVDGKWTFDKSVPAWVS